MNMLDPTAIADPKDYSKDEIEGLFVRRFRKDVQSELGKSFPERTMRQVHATATPAEEAVFDGLVQLTFSTIDQRKHGAMLFKTTLEKALFSSPAACRQTIAERLKTISSRKMRVSSTVMLRLFVSSIRSSRESTLRAFPSINGYCT